jgi:hypothetical protein
MGVGNLVGGVENFSDKIMFLKQILAHANNLGTLAGK